MTLIRNLDNFYWVLYPWLFHPASRILYTAGILITVLLRYSALLLYTETSVARSLDRYVAVFHPYRVYQLAGWARTLVRGPKGPPNNIRERGRK